MHFRKVVALSLLPILLVIGACLNTGCGRAAITMMRTADALDRIGEEQRKTTDEMYAEERESDDRYEAEAISRLAVAIVKDANDPAAVEDDIAKFSDFLSELRKNRDEGRRRYEVSIANLNDSFEMAAGLRKAAAAELAVESDFSQWVNDYLKATREARAIKEQESRETQSLRQQRRLDWLKELQTTLKSKQKEGVTPP